MTEEGLKAVEILTEEFRNRLIESIKRSEILTINGSNPEERLNHYFQMVCDFYCIDKDKTMKNKNRIADYKNPRQIAWFLINRGESRIPISLKRIGILTDKIHGFNHATVLHGINVIANALQVDVQLRKDVKHIASMLGMELVKDGNDWVTVRTLEKESA